MNDDDNAHRTEEVAIIGMTGRFPGARDINQYWQNIKNGVESISFFSNPEIEAAGGNPVMSAGYVGAAGVLDNIDLFDSSFFGFDSREADILDPQQRIFLESAWEALEDAGYSAESYQGRIGVYASSTISTYLLNSVIMNQGAMNHVGRARSIMGNDSNFLATRVSYKLNLSGPSMVVQTACSSSLLVVHLACQSLLSGESDMALAGGISINVPQMSSHGYSEGGIHSPEGHCRAFDAKASGTVMGSGVGIVVLKRLLDAIADGDFIHAIIKGSAVNNDGYLKIGYTAPSVGGQAAVVGEALAMAGIDPETITYIEAHGTGTLIGDPIEISALTQAFRATTDKKNFCAIGSVKTNIGHLDVASGVAGLIKTIMALKHKLIPASLHFHEPNPRIDFANSPFYVNTKLSKWEAGRTARRAGVSSLGIGGTNVHMIVEEAPQVEAFAPSILSQLLLLSAKSNSSLETATDNLVEAMRHSPGMDLANVSFTLQAGRKAFDYRRAIICKGLKDAITTLGECDSERMITQFHGGSEQPIAFMFTGQGTRGTNMMRQLREEIAIFGELVNECAAIIKQLLGLDLLPVLSSQAALHEMNLDETLPRSIKELALFTTEYVLARVWMDCGVRPQAMIGYNVGEYVVACIAGVLTLAEGLQLAAARGQLLEEVPFAEMTDKAIKPFMDLLNNISLKGPQIPYVSSVTGQWITAQQATDPAYWARHLRLDPILGDGLEVLMKESRRIMFEIDPGETLCALARSRVLLTGQQPMMSTPIPEGEFPSSRLSFLNTLAQLWIAGIKINSSGLYMNERHLRISLPTYPFEKQRHWVESTLAKEGEIQPRTK